MSRHHRRALSHLRRVDPVLARVIDRVGPCRLQIRAEGTHFDALARAIVFQQLSGAAARTIFGRVTALYPGDSLDPAAILATPDDTLRAAGLSRQKIAYLRDLSSRVSSGALPLGDVESMSDDDLIAHLVQVKGIGRRTAQMFLLFRLGRPDVLPDLDLGIQNAIQREYRMRKRPAPGRVQRVGAPWSPFSSVAAWYLWRSLENGDGQLGAE